MKEFRGKIDLIYIDPLFDSKDSGLSKKQCQLYNSKSLLINPLTTLLWKNTAHKCMCQILIKQTNLKELQNEKQN